MGIASKEEVIERVTSLWSDDLSTEEKWNVISNLWLMLKGFLVRTVVNSQIGLR